MKKTLISLLCFSSTVCFGGGLGGGLVNPSISAEVGSSASVGGLVIVMTNGNDSTGVRNNIGFPFATPKAGVAAAQAGDCVIQFPGLYTNGVNSLGKSGVTLYCYPGVTNFYLCPSTNDPCLGFVDDRNGVISNCVISGHGTWLYSCGTNGLYDEDNFWYAGSTNSRGAVFLGNFGSSLIWESDDCYYGDLGNSGISHGEAFFRILNSQYADIRCKQLFDLYPDGVTIPTINFGPQLIPSVANAFYWSNGELHFQFTHCHLFIGVNSFWLDETITTHTNFQGEAWVKGDLLESKFYMSGITPNWRAWVKIGQAKVTYGGPAFALLGPGKYYIETQKSESTGTGQAALTMGSSTTNGDMQVWFKSMKVSSDTAWFNVNSGTLYADVGHFEDTGAGGGTVDQGIKVGPTNAQNVAPALFLNGLSAVANNGRVVSILGGTNYISGLRMCSTNNIAAYVTNGSTVFNSCLFISKTSSNSIDSGTIAVNVGLIGGMQNRAKGPNVTVQPGTAVVDTNLK